MRGLGTTWVERGTAYWVRRGWLLLVRLIMVLGIALLAGAGWRWLVGASWAAGWRGALDVATGLIVVVGMLAAARDVLTAYRLRLTPQEWRARNAERRARHPFLTAPAVVNTLVLVCLPVSGPLLLGYLAVYLIGVSCGRELPAERGARADLERQAGMS
ncbi:hypothetical protein CK485_09385 [Streptomyces sp. ICBB 8177]|nr:hypothetical protein CK485_09385 [Streptomyces sp. ICBB 8177]